VLAEEDRDHYNAVDALRAFREGILSEDIYIRSMDRIHLTLGKNGVGDLNFRGNHIPISIDNAGNIVTDQNGMPETRICNFELLRRFAAKERRWP